jgi:hypothetical protein
MNRWTPLACALLLLAFSSPASAEVDWTHELTDGPGDVASHIDPGTPVSGQERIDIETATIRAEGDDINVTLTIVGVFDADSTYSLEAVADGDDAKTYTFSHSFGVWSVTGHDLVEDQPETYVSPDGHRISWVLAKDQVSAEADLTISRVDTLHIGTTQTFFDEAVPGNGNGGAGGDDEVKDGTPGFGTALVVAGTMSACVIALRRRG